MDNGVLRIRKIDQEFKFRLCNRWGSVCNCVPPSSPDAQSSL